MDIKEAHDRKQQWLGVDEIFNDLWDYTEKRVLSETLSQTRSPLLMMLAVLKNLLVYRKPVFLLQDGDARGITHAFLSLDTRPDHLAQESLIIRELQPSIILTDKAQDGSRTFSCTLKERLQALRRAISVSRLAVSKNVITWRQFPKILNVLVKTFIDRLIAEKMACLFREKQGAVVLSCLQMESLRGMVKPLKSIGVRCVTYQHGILGHNGGFSEEHKSDVRVLWKEQDRLTEVRNSTIVAPTKMLVCSTHPGFPPTEIRPERKVSHVVYVSSPSLAGKIDPDMVIMRRIAEDITQRDLVEKLVFCLHPSKSISDYPFLKNFNVISGMHALSGRLNTSHLAFIGLNSTALYNKALDCHPVGQIRIHADGSDAMDDSTLLPGLTVSEIFDRNDLPDTSKIKLVEDRKALYVSQFGNYVPGALKVKLFDEFG